MGVFATLRTIRATLRNPLEAMPPAVYEQPVTQGRLLGRRIVHLMDPALIHAALVANANKLDKGDVARRPLAAALGNGLLNAEGADWRWQRRAIAPIFRAGGIEAFFPAMAAAATRAAAGLVGQSVAVNHAMMRATFDIIAETMLSGAANIDVARVEQDMAILLRQARWSILASTIGVPAWVPEPGRRRAAGAASYLRGKLMACIAARRASGAGAGDLIDLLLAARDPETGQEMNDTEITDNLMTFLLAGHETTALGLAWTLDLLGRHPEVARRARAEILAVTQGAPLAPEHAGQLSYVTQIFKEALRLYPAAPIIARRVLEPFTLGDISLEKEMMLIIPIHAVHRHRTLWEAPHIFDPDRFTPEAEAARHRYAYMPFGAGPRICIGSGFAMLEATIILATLLRDLRFISQDPTPPSPQMDITLRPSRPLRMRVEPVG